MASIKKYSKDWFYGVVAGKLAAAVLHTSSVKYLLTASSKTSDLIAQSFEKFMESYCSLLAVVLKLSLNSADSLSVFEFKNDLKGSTEFTESAGVCESSLNQLSEIIQSDELLYEGIALYISATQNAIKDVLAADMEAIFMVDTLQTELPFTLDKPGADPVQEMYAVKLRQLENKPAPACKIPTTAAPPAPAPRSVEEFFVKQGTKKAAVNTPKSPSKKDDGKKSNSKKEDTKKKDTKPKSEKKKTTKKVEKPKSHDFFQKLVRKTSLSIQNDDNTDSSGSDTDNSNVDNDLDTLEMNFYESESD